MTKDFAKVALYAALKDAMQFAATAGWGGDEGSELLKLTCVAECEAKDVLARKESSNG